MGAEMRTALVIGAHLDDCECGSAACISLKLSKAGWRVVFLNTIGDHSGWSFVSSWEMEERLIEEAHSAAAVLGAEKMFLPFAHNMLHPSDANVVTAIAKVVQTVNPTLAFIPWPDDNHYDHMRTAYAALEALSYANRFAGKPEVKMRLKEILAYEISSWQTRSFDPDFFIEVDDELDCAVKAIKAFHSLGERTLEHYAGDKMLRCQHWGLGAGCRFAEGLKHLGPQFPVKSLLSDIFGDSLVPTGSSQYPWGAKFFR